jgi:membrane protein implicated in regulation of membrane protease activity
MINPLLSISSRLADVVAPEIVENNVETSSSSGFVFSAWLIWVIVALFFIILEIFTVGFAVACFSIGAIASAIVAALGGGLAWQLIAFSVVTFLAFVTVRPLVLKHFYQSDEAQRKSNADALIGRKAKVTEEINNDQRTGRVAIDGDNWRAVTLNNLIVSKGSTVIVKSRDSIILTVEPVS